MENRPMQRSSDSPGNNYDKKENHYHIMIATTMAVSRINTNNKPHPSPSPNPNNHNPD